jgi:hypothetical protein
MSSEIYRIGEMGVKTASALTQNSFLPLPPFYSKIKREERGRKGCLDA